MKKLLLTLAVGVVVAIMATAMFIGDLIKSGVEEFAPKLMGVSVEVGDVDVNILSGKLALQKVVVGNPDGFSDKLAFAVDDIYVHLKTDSLFSDEITIYKVVIDKPNISYELGAGKTNLGVIQANAKSEDSSEESSRKVIIELLQIKSAKVHTSVGAVGKELSIPDIEMKNIGKSDRASASFAEVVAVVMATVIKTVAESNVTGVGKTIEEGAKSLGNSIKNLFE